jgi:hypothetical protein
MFHLDQQGIARAGSGGTAAAQLSAGLGAGGAGLGSGPEPHTVRVKCEASDCGALLEVSSSRGCQVAALQPRLVYIGSPRPAGAASTFSVLCSRNGPHPAGAVLWQCLQVPGPIPCLLLLGRQTQPQSLRHNAKKADGLTADGLLLTAAGHPPKQAGSTTNAPTLCASGCRWSSPPTPRASQ